MTPFRVPFQDVIVMFWLVSAQVVRSGITKTAKTFYQLLVIEHNGVLSSHLRQMLPPFLEKVVLTAQALDHTKYFYHF